jgi:hypothetical protein
VEDVMTTNLYLLNLALLAFVLWANLGTRTVTTSRLVLPVVLVVVAAAAFLRHVPTAGHDVALEAAGVGAGLALGVLAGALVRVERAERDEQGQRLVMRAGAAYAALWVAVIGGRMLFAYGADHWFALAIGRFSVTHQITGADAWTAAFIMLSLTMVLARVATSAAVIAAASRRGHDVQRSAVPVI